MFWLFIAVLVCVPVGVVVLHASCSLPGLLGVLLPVQQKGSQAAACKFAVCKQLCHPVLAWILVAVKFCRLVCLQTVGGAAGRTLGGLDWTRHPSKPLLASAVAVVNCVLCHVFACREVEAAMTVPGTVPSAATAGSSSRMTTTTGTTSALAPPSTTRGITHPTAAAATSPMSTAAAHTAPLTPSGAAARPRSATAATASPTAYGTECATSSAIREPSLKLAEPAGNAGGSFPASSGGLQGEAVRAAAAVGRGSGSTAPFGHLAGEERYDERYNASSAGEGFGAKTAVGSDNVLDSFASPVKAAGAGGLAGTGLAGTGTVAGAGAGDVGVAAESAHMGTGGHSINGVGAATATGGHGMATAALHEADLAGKAKGVVMCRFSV